jgi:hypothetical protein
MIMRRHGAECGEEDRSGRADFSGVLTSPPPTFRFRVLPQFCPPASVFPGFRAGRLGIELLAGLLFGPDAISAEDIRKSGCESNDADGPGSRLPIRALGDRDD